MSTYVSKLGTIIVEVPVTTQTPASWGNWRFTANHRYLVAPDGQHITRQRLEGLLWRDQMELLKAGYASRRKAEAGKKRYNVSQRVKVVVVDLADWHERHFGMKAA